jgi:protocatechuate 3,4-dioxygenase beta subunit
MMNTTNYLLQLIFLTIGIIASACEPRVALTPEQTPESETVKTEQTILSDEATNAPGMEQDVPAYFTPSQQEGPYYPVDKPADHDNDLVNFAGAAEVPVGEVLVFNGVVYDASGIPVEGVVIEIWQTDSNGVYLHPDDPASDQRDRNFQFYGEAITGIDGVYSFRTLIPGYYEPRPRHIHVKVKRDGEVLLTTQFYFAKDVSYSDDRIHLVIDLAPAEDDNGNPIWIGQRDIILNIDR